MPTDDEGPSPLHKPRAAKDKKAFTYCFRSADNEHHPRVLRREINQVCTDNLKSWPRMPLGMHVREYVECADCGKYAMSAAQPIHESYVMWHVTHGDRPLLPNRLVADE